MYKLILASSSPFRLEQLKSIGYEPDEIFPAYIDETILKKETPKQLAKRLAKEKCIKVANQKTNSFIIAADTVSCVGKKIIDKALTDDDVRNALNSFSGKKHIVHTAITIAKKNDKDIERIATKLVTSSIKFRKLSNEEIDEYVNSGEGIGKSGGCSIQNRGAAFIKWIQGSYSAIIGMPLCEVKTILDNFGYKNESVCKN